MDSLKNEKLLSPKRGALDLNTVKTFVVFLLALGAPSAGTYITYETMKTQTSLPLTWIAAMSVCAARLTFSNFTLNRLADNFIGTISDGVAIKHDENPTTQKRLEQLRHGMERANPSHLRALSLVASSTPAINDRSVEAGSSNTAFEPS